MLAHCHRVRTENEDDHEKEDEVGLGARNAEQCSALLSK
jgi:hypothetical protein